jgi:hypothetical protein
VTILRFSNYKEKERIVYGYINHMVGFSTCPIEIFGRSDEPISPLGCNCFGLLGAKDFRRLELKLSSSRGDFGPCQEDIFHANQKAL